MEQFCICIPAVATSTQLITPNRKPSLRDLMRQSKPAITFANLKESWPVCNFGLDLAVPGFEPQTFSSKNKFVVIPG